MPVDMQPFTRNAFQSSNTISVIGQGDIGGKARGLVTLGHILQGSSIHQDFSQISISIPALVVIRTEVFDNFIQNNRLKEIVFSGAPDDRIAHAFMRAELPFELLGDLRSIVTQTRNPLAVRSSSLLEDSTYEPFAGIFKTKMLPNNQLDVDTRFRKLVEAIKLVFASTYFQASRDYMTATGHDLADEKMAVIVQEVVGKPHSNRFYPELSGVARSYNFYPVGTAKQSDGIINLALGLGKTIVDGGRCWSYSPSNPRVGPPYGSVKELLKFSQTEFWSINLGTPPKYDPIRETEFMNLEKLKTAEEDQALRFIASTFNPDSERLVMGVGNPGPRAITFEPILRLGNPPLNDLVRRLLEMSETALDGPVEIEFAMTFDPHQFGFLQARKMVIPSDVIDINEDEMQGEHVLSVSQHTLGNGQIRDICDIVFVRPETFELKHSQAIAEELMTFNQDLGAENRPYLLIVFGRLGSSSPWLGIPVKWSQISGSKVIIEATLENANVDMSQGSHFFHNMINLGVFYFSVPFTQAIPIDWEWLNSRPVIRESEFVRHVRINTPLDIKTDGRSGRGVISKYSGGNHE